MGEKERQNGSCAVVRSRSEEARIVRNWLMLVACLPLGTRVMPGPELLPIAISGSLIARVYADIHDPCCHTKATGMPQGLGHHLDHFGVMILLGPC